MRFDAKGNFSLSFMGAFMIKEHVDNLAYELQLVELMSGLHDVFHVSIFDTYLRDPECHITLKPVTIEPYLSFEFCEVSNLERSERVLWRKTFKYVNILWTNQTEPGGNLGP